MFRCGPRGRPHLGDVRAPPERGAGPGPWQSAGRPWSWRMDTKRRWALECEVIEKGVKTGEGRMAEAMEGSVVGSGDPGKVESFQVVETECCVAAVCMLGGCR